MRIGDLIMTKVSENEFELVGENTIEHMPTGAQFSAYRYVDAKPEEIDFSSKNPGRAGEILADGWEYDPGDVQSKALELYRDHIRKRRR
jgi:hypothetical protein